MISKDAKTSSKTSTKPFRRELLNQKRTSHMDTAAITTGVLTMLVAFIPGLEGKDRAWCAIGGAVFAGCGLLVLNQTSGTFYFPVILFVLPIVMIAKAIADLRWEKKHTQRR